MSSQGEGGDTQQLHLVSFYHKVALVVVLGVKDIFLGDSFGALLILPYLSPGWGFLSLTIVTSGATAESIILLLKYNI